MIQTKSSPKKTKKCKKKKYFLREDALSVLWKARQGGRKRRKEQRVYFCKDCNGYHLTSKGEEVSKYKVADMYIKQVLYGKQREEYVRLKNFDLDKVCEEAKKELHKRIDWMFDVEKWKNRKRVG